MMLFSAFFSGMEIAFITSNKLRIEIEKSKGPWTGQILSDFAKSPAKLIGSLLLGNNIALVIYGIAMANVLTPWLQMWISDGAGTALLILVTQTIIATLLILLLAEFLPKVLFRINPNAVLTIMAVPLAFFYYVLYPFVYIFTGLSEAIFKHIFRIKFIQKERIFTPVDLDEYIREYAENVQHPDEVQQEIQIFQNVIEFRDARLKECMVPRPEIVAVEENDPVSLLKEKLIDFGLSRIIVYRDTIDNVIGYVHSFDMFKMPAEIKSILNPIHFYPETMLAGEAMAQLIRDHKSIAVVVDEFGGTGGIVTLEDIIEEILGEIEDEFDIEGMVEKVVSDNEYIFSGRLEIDYVNEKYKLELPESDEYETLAGLIIHYHESIPALHETIVVNRFHFEILQATETRIELVRVKVEEQL